MNPTAIEWTHIFGPATGFTWNPVVGCTAGCPYCYARQQAKRQKQNCQQCYDFTPHLHQERLAQPLHRRKPAGIFVGSMCDLWDPAVSMEWRRAIYDVMIQTPQHRYFALTKQPQNMETGKYLPENLLTGFSCCDQDTYYKRIGEYVERCDDRRIMVSIEPLLGRVYNLIGLGPQDWVIVGLQTGRGAVHNPSACNWIDEIAGMCRMKGVPCFVKDNAGGRQTVGRNQEWPVQA